ncbi:MAG TPA: hypothetical protein VIX90_02825 [Edaphobacter sp.]
MDGGDLPLPQLLNNDLSYTFSKALGIRGACNNGIAGDPTNLRADYGPLAFDRTGIIGASYSSDMGEHFHSGNRLLRGLGNFWLISGITNWQSGLNLQAVYNPSFNLQGYANSSYGGCRCATG